MKFYVRTDTEEVDRSTNGAVLRRLNYFLLTSYMKKRCVSSVYLNRFKLWLVSSLFRYARLIISTSRRVRNNIRRASLKHNFIST